jgi:hypothetical protein
MAIENCLDGSRQWDGIVDLERFLRGVIRSLASSERKRFVLERTDATANDDLPEHPAKLVSSPEDDLAAEQARASLVAAIEAIANEDPDLVSYYLAVLEVGSKRADVVAFLDWPPGRVKNARRRLERLHAARVRELAAKGGAHERHA